MKRILALFLTLLLFVPCLTIPASASQVTGSQFDEFAGDLGTVLRDMKDSIVDAIYEMWDGLATDIWYLIDSIDDNFVDLLDTALPGISNILDNIHSKLTAIDTFFFTESSYTVSIPTQFNTSLGISWRNISRTIQITGFQYCLLKPVELLSPWFCSVANAIIGDTAKSDQFDDDKAPVETQVDEWLEELETAPTISPDSMDIIFDTGIAIDEDYMSFLQFFVTQEVFVYPILFSFIFATIGYLMYGKR